MSEVGTSSTRSDKSYYFLVSARSVRESIHIDLRERLLRLRGVHPEMLDTVIVVASLHPRPVKLARIGVEGIVQVGGISVAKERAG